MTTPQNEPSLAELLAEVRTATSEAVTEMAGIQAEFAAVAAEQRAEREAAEHERAEKARSGELGAEQRRLQERIDLGQTDWGAVVSGIDDSPEAAELRGQLDRNAQAFAQAVDEHLEGEQLAGRPDPRAELFDVVGELRATLAELAAQASEERRGQ